MSGSVNQMQMRVWILTAMLAPLAHASGAGWATMLLAAVVLLPLAALPVPRKPPGKLLLWLGWGSVAAAAAVLLPASGSYWPGRSSEIVVPLVLLLLAGLTQNETRSANAAGILGWGVGLMGAAVWVLAMKEVRPAWLRPQLTSWNGSLVFPMLLPVLFRSQMPGRKNWLFLAAGLAAILGILVQGNLSLGIAGQQNAPFYEMAGSLRVGSLSRLEPMVSLLLTFSWYSLALALVMAGKSYLCQIGLTGRTALWLTVMAMGGGILFGVQDEIKDAAKIGILVWLMLPKISCEK